MRKLILSISISAFFGAAGFSQEFETFEFNQGDTTFLMKKYFLLLYTEGDNRNQDVEEASEIQKAHLQHLNQLGDAKKLCVAGPFDGELEEKGLIIYSVYSEEEAHKLSKNDPAVKAGRLSYRILPFWAAKGSKLF